MLSTANVLRDDNQDVVLPLPHGGQQPPERVGPRKVELSEEKAGESGTSLDAMFLCSLDIAIDDSLVGQLTIHQVKSFLESLSNLVAMLLIVPQLLVIFDWPKPRRRAFAPSL